MLQIVFTPAGESLIASTVDKNEEHRASNFIIFLLLNVLVVDLASQLAPRPA